ncbi:MAG: putative bifunctional diguanylate cyclase/phosphodiesterase, partial [Anaerolineae bacterium]
PLSAFDVVHLYATEITERERAEEAMRKLNAELELRVEERTAELKATNERLQREITERKRVEEALREGEERFRELYEEAPIAYYSVGVDGRICRANRNTAEMSGYALDDLVGRPVFDLYADTPAGKEKAQEVFQRFRAGEEIRGEELEWRTADGRSVWISITVRPFRDAEGRIVESRAMAVDITDRKRAEEQLLHDAFHDALTGLPNRALFVDRMIQAIERAKRHEEYMFAVLFLDLDRFKVVNDSLGHTIGDELLIAIARRLEVCLRAIDTVARLGGDEFVLLVEDIEDVSDATRVAERVQEELRLPFNLHGHEVFTTASIGIVLSTTGYDRPEEILRDADIAMYRAKVRGKARYELFDTAMRDRAVARLELETELRRAIERQEFRVHYQPIVSLAAGRIAGFEALLRWQHPERGLVSPGEFIPVAEETGLIIPIGQWVLREACQQMRDWQVQFPGGPPLTISVNLFRRQFQQPDLVEQVEQILQETGLDARSLRLEITESVIMENTESATAMLSQLKAMGVQVQMDDFGTGYSSLSYLNQFPIDTIKIDRTFVSKMGVDGNHSGIVHTMLTLARDLGMDTIAEGVETAEQLAYLKELECEYGQGYHLSKPLDSEAAEALIAHRAAEQENFEPSLVKTLDPPSVSHPLPTHPEDSRFLHG